MSYSNLGLLLYFNSDDRVSNFDSQYLSHFSINLSKSGQIWTPQILNIPKLSLEPKFDPRIWLLYHFFPKGDFFVGHPVQLHLFDLVSNNEFY